MLHYFGKSRYLRKWTTHREPQKGSISNGAQIYTVACKTHTMCSILWPSQHGSKSFETSFQALLCFQ